MSALTNRVKKLEIDARIGVTQHVELYLKDYSFLVLDDKKQPYRPVSTGLEFHKSDDFVRLIIGPYGSGKSTACCAEILFRACTIAPCRDGVRRSRWALVRNTYGDLVDTSLKTWLEWFEMLGAVRRRLAPRLNYHHTFNDGGGRIELELMFIALDRPDHIRKLKSLELTGVYLNELAEIPEAALTHFKGRVNRFPATRDCDKDYWSGIIADTNPPETDHWLYNLFEITRPSGHRILHQPPAIFKTQDGYEINPEADNLAHLKGGGQYYLDMMQGQSEEYIKVYVMGQYGTVVEGKHVYNNYNDDLHSKEDFGFYNEESILLAWDYGTISPACLITQFVNGIMFVIKEFVCEYMTPKELYETSVKPFLVKYCQGLPMECIGDPADTYDGMEQLQEVGLPIAAARTNDLDTRLRCVRDFLNVLVKGEPKILVSRPGCPKLRQGFLGKYHYKRLKVVGEERYKDVPDKNHPYSDIHDCLQYAAMHYADYEVPEEKRVWWPSDFLEDEGKSEVGGY